MDKAELRQYFRVLRESFPPAKVITDSIAICMRLARWSELRMADNVLTYLAFRNEPDLSLLFDLLPRVRWYLPRVAGDNLVIHPYVPLRLRRHRFGMLEPEPDLPVVDPQTISVVLTPGISFDRSGGRLGFGGGYYDRFLSTTPALRVGITYDECLTDRLPRTDQDQLMDWIATPSQIIPCRAGDSHLY